MTELDLSGSNIGDEGMAHLQGMKLLKELDLSETDISDAGLERLANLSSLEELRIQKTQASDAAVEAFKRRLPTCRVIHLVDPVNEALQKEIGEALENVLDGLFRKMPPVDKPSR